MKLDKKSIIITLQFIVCVFIGLEVSIEPNPYTNELIICLVLFICLKYDIDKKILNSWSKWFD